MVVGFWLVAALLAAATVMLVIRPLSQHNDDGKPGADLGGKSGGRRERSPADNLSHFGIPPGAEVKADGVTCDEAAKLCSHSGDELKQYCQPSQEARISWRSKLGVSWGYSVCHGKQLAYLISGVIPLGGLLIYLWLGYPYPSTDTRTGELLQVLSGLRTQLTQEPDDTEGWILLAHTYGQLGAVSESLLAWEQAFELDPSHPVVVGGLAEILVIQGGGVVSSRARDLFAALHQLAPSNPQARHYLALHQAQSGDLMGALKNWQELIATADTQAGWLPVVRFHFQHTARALGLDPEALLRVTPGDSR